MSTHEQPRVDTGRRLTFRDVIPLVGFIVPTIVTAYGSVMPRHGITGLNELTVGFASTVFGASLAYMIGLRAAIRRRSGIASPAPAHQWRRPEWIAPPIRPAERHRRLDPRAHHADGNRRGERHDSALGADRPGRSRARRRVWCRARRAMRGSAADDGTRRGSRSVSDHGAAGHATQSPAHRARPSHHRDG